MAAANTMIAAGVGELDSVLGGETRFYPWREGNIFYKVQGEGRPVLLLHGIHAAASSYEWRKNFDPLGESFRVFAPDLLGFGLSERPPITYDAQLYIDLVADFIRDVVAAPAAVIASSLTCAYAIEHAARAREEIDHLILICPTATTRQSAAVRPFRALSQQLLRLPVVGSTLFNGLSSRASIGHFLRERVYYDPSLVDEAMVEYYYTAAHQEGARYAPAAFIGGALDLDVSEAFAALTQPTLLVWGRQASETPVEDAEAFQRLNPKAELRIFEYCGMLPHDEYADEFNQLVRERLGQRDVQT